MAGEFKPTFWSKYCQTELKKDLVLANWCDYKFEGEIKRGAKLKVVGANKPTVGKYVPGTDINIEKLGDNAQYIEIDQFDYFGFTVDDVDKAQSQEGYLETQFDEAKVALAESTDKFVGTLAKGALANMTSASTDISAETDPFATIDTAVVKLYKNDVSAMTELAADLNPDHINLCKKALAKLFTDNVEYIKRSAVGKYNNVYLRMTNQLYNNGTDDFEMIRTKKAIAFCDGFTEIKKSDLEKQFGQLIKGLHIYGGKVVRPKELAVIKVH